MQEDLMIVQTSCGPKKLKLELLFFPNSNCPTYIANVINTPKFHAYECSHKIKNSIIDDYRCYLCGHLLG